MTMHVFVTIVITGTALFAAFYLANIPTRKG